MNSVQPGSVRRYPVGKTQKLYPVPHLKQNQYAALLRYRSSYFCDVQPNIFQLTAVI
jgi:hypothetical protein